MRRFKIFLAMLANALLMGLVVLVINMVIYMIHFFDVQHRFRAVKVNEVYQDLVDAEYIFD